MNLYIVKKENKFVVETHEKMPENGIMPSLDYSNVSTKYLLVNKSLEFLWGTNYLLKIDYKGKTIDSYKTCKIQQVCDFMNKYSSLTEKELDELLIADQNQIRSELEEEIETMKKEKQQLEEEVYLYKQIKAKREELNNLLAKLEENTKEEKE